MRQRIFFFLCFLLTHFALCKVCVSQTHHFFFKDSTGDSYSIVIDSVILDGREVENGDEIGVFTSGGLCVGASELDRDFPVPLVAWKDDPQTQETDGFIEGDTMFFRFWDNREGAEREGMPHYIIGNGTFGYGSYSQLYLLVSNSGVWDTAEAKSDLPFLLQNYPNPFNMATRIEYSLCNDAHVSITVYNLKGQKIRALVNQTQGCGQKAVIWDQKDDKGEEVASGIYFYKIKAGEFTQTKKMVILK